MSKGSDSLMMVGIYWCVESVIIGDAVSFDQAEESWEALQHGSHYDFWENLVSQNYAKQKLRARAYDAYPRGRVVYFPG